MLGEIPFTIAKNSDDFTLIAHLDRNIQGWNRFAVLGAGSSHDNYVRGRLGQVCLRCIFQARLTWFAPEFVNHPYRQLLLGNGYGPVELKGRLDGNVK